jgi:hypothetical protein
MRINDKRETPYHCRLMGYNGKEAKEKNNAEEMMVKKL